MRYRSFFQGLSVFLILSSWSCTSSTHPDTVETTTRGEINISVDESFQPVIEEQIKVFQSQHPDAHIHAYYKSEADCLRDLEVDSIRMVIVTRGLTDEEQRSFRDTLSFMPSFGIMAWDAVAVIVNRQSDDSLFTLPELTGLLLGNGRLPYKVVMDGTNATSAVRFVMDSLLRGRSPGSSVEGAKGSQAVIDYVATHTDAVGLLGVSWIGNPEDPEQQSFLQKVQLAALECRGCKMGPFVKPYQANIYTGRYPLIRPLYYILKENFDGLGSGFRNFLTLEKGQRIFKRAYLLPSRMSFEVQNMDLSD